MSVLYYLKNRFDVYLHALVSCFAVTMCHPAHLAACCISEAFSVLTRCTLQRLKLRKLLQEYGSIAPATQSARPPEASRKPVSSAVERSGSYAAAPPVPPPGFQTPAPSHVQQTMTQASQSKPARGVGSGAGDTSFSRVVGRYVRECVPYHAVRASGVIVCSS